MKSLILLTVAGHDLYTSVFDQDDESIGVDFSKPPAYDDPSVNKVETPQTLKALQPKLMVMLGPRCPKVAFPSDQEIVETPEAPHHSFLFLEDQSHT